VNRSTSLPSRRCRALVVGLGSIDRGDDAVGPIVAGRVRDALQLSGDSWVDVAVHEDPSALPDVMSGMDIAIIVDAVRSGDGPGTVTWREVGRDEPALPVRSAPGAAGTHGLGLATVIELARTMDLLPARVVVVGVEAVDFAHGRPMSAPVMSAVPHAVESILGILRMTDADRDAAPSRVSRMG
jgi:hydrogenase maturation protease